MPFCTIIYDFWKLSKTQGFPLLLCSSCVALVEPISYFITRNILNRPRNSIFIAPKIVYNFFRFVPFYTIIFHNSDLNSYNFLKTKISIDLCHFILLIYILFLRICAILYYKSKLFKKSNRY